MVNANIHEGDILVIDKSFKPAEGLPVVTPTGFILKIMLFIFAYTLNQIIE
ncbi:hypothetical protein [Pontibacter diazotrophicus]